IRSACRLHGVEQPYEWKTVLLLHLLAKGAIFRAAVPRCRAVDQQRYGPDDPGARAFPVPGAARTHSFRQGTKKAEAGFCLRFSVGVFRSCYAVLMFRCLRARLAARICNVSSLLVMSSGDVMP